MSSKNRSLFILFIAAVSIVFLSIVAGCGGGSAGSGAMSISGTVTSQGAVIAVNPSPESKRHFLVKLFELVPPAYALDKDTSLEGTPLVGAVVDLSDQNGNLIATTTTDQNGRFEFLSVPEGEYSLSVSDPSIETLVIEGVTVLAGDTAVIHGTVTASGGTADVEYSVGDCSPVAENQAQLGHASALADAAGVSVDEVIQLRETNCLGWGVIAQHLEVAPSVIGLGHTQTHGGGKPDHAGPPANTGGGKPEHAGTPGPPDHAGPPENQGNGPKK